MAARPRSVASLWSLVCKELKRSIAPIRCPCMTCGHRHTKFARHSDRGSVAAPARGHGQAPLLQWIVDLEELFADSTSKARIAPRP